MGPRRSSRHRRPTGRTGRCVVPLQRHVVAGRHDAALHGVEQAPGDRAANGVIAVPADTPSDVTVLTDAIDPVGTSTATVGSRSRCGAGNPDDADAVREPTVKAPSVKSPPCR